MRYTDKELAYAGGTLGIIAVLSYLGYEDFTHGSYFGCIIAILVIAVLIHQWYTAKPVEDDAQPATATIEGIVHYKRNNSGAILSKVLRFQHSDNPYDYSDVEQFHAPPIIEDILGQPEYEGKKVRLTIEILE